MDSIRVTWFEGIDIPMIEMWMPYKVDPECTDETYSYLRLNNPDGLTEDEWYEALRTSRSECYRLGKYAAEA